MRLIPRILRHRRVLFGILLAASIASVDARAQNVVYHSPDDTGANPGTTFNLPVGPGETLFLYLDTGALASGSGTIACFDGDGRETCGYEILIDALGSAFFVDFIPEPNVVHRLTQIQAEINGLFSLNPALGAVKIGELKVASSDQDGAVMMTSGTVVLAALQTETVPQAMLAAVPEPIGSLPLGAGMLLLLGLGRRRAASLARSLTTSRA